MPLTVISYLYVRASRELKVREGPLAIMTYEARSREGQPRVTYSCQNFRDSQQDCGSSHHAFPGQAERARNYDLYEAELNVRKEKRNQKYLIFMVSAFAICLCPLMVLRVATLAVSETYENSGLFDIIYALFVWIGFLPTCTTPSLFASWIMSRPEKDRLRGYFRFGNLKLRRAARENQCPLHPMAMAPCGTGANSLCNVDTRHQDVHSSRCHINTALSAC